MDLIQRFAEAGHDGRPWRATTFWSWNDRLDPDEVRRQVRELARGGLGGAFLHARRGLRTAYLGPEWLEAVRAAIEEGGHTGVQPWLYDEDCWPSGACSGRVYAGREAFRQKSLGFEEIQPSQWQPGEGTVAVFVASKEARGRYAAWRRLADPREIFGRRLARHEAAVHFVYRTGEGVDVFSREATAEFLRQTHEVYRSAVGGEFGRAIPGIFTDEPQYAGNGHRVPWSLELPRFFRRSCHYDLVDRLPELFFPVGDYRKTRFDFYQTVTRLFLLAWTMPVYQWCARHGLALTGHVMGEESLRFQVQWAGAAMPHYEYMHIPGIDHLGRGLGSPLVMKQAASVAAQWGRPRVLGEMFGGAGWNTSFDDLRWMAEWQFALGVNLVCTHLASFTLRGVRKRDFPPSLHYHQPWWPQFCLWNDYVARLLTVLGEGTAVADVLVIHPMASAWAEYSPLDPAPVEELDARLRRLVDFILATHADFHFGDELILERQGRVAGRDLAVGACRYRLVVVPDATNLRASTVRLLARFRQAGGAVVFAGRVPARVDGQPSKDVAALARRSRRADVETVRGRAALRGLLAPRLEVLNAGGKDAAAIVAQWRRAGKDHIFFFLNTDPRRQVRATLRLPEGGTPVRLDPATGQVWTIESQVRGKRVVFPHTFGPRESLLVVQTAEPPAEALPPPEVPSRRLRLTGRWNVRRLDPNALVLDMAQWRTEEGTYGEPMPVLDIQQELLRRAAQQPVVLRFEFDCALKDVEGRRFDLVLEDPQAFEMWYNGMRTPLADAGPYWDSAFRRIDVTSFVRPGRNVIELKRPWHVEEGRRLLLSGRASGWGARTLAADSELEAVYLVGDFGVAFSRGSRRGPDRTRGGCIRGSRWMQGRPRLVGEPSRLGGGDLVRAGYPFFVGRLRLERDVILRCEPSPDAVLELPPFAAVTAAVHVNGEEAGVVWQTPRRVAVGNLLRRGRNHLAVTLTTSLRNLLGPHHHPAGELLFVHPGSFACEKGWLGRPPGHRSVLDAYNVVDFGLGGSVVLRY